MDIGTVSMRYAKALLQYAEECKAEECVYEQAVTMLRSLVEVKELQAALINPVINRTTKMDLLSKAAGNTLNPINERFLHLVFDQHRERQLIFILHSFISRYRKRKNILVGKLTTAVPLNPSVIERLRHEVTNSTKGTVEFEIKVDETIQGGFILQLDNQRMDASIKGQLALMRKNLMR